MGDPLATALSQMAVINPESINAHTSPGSFRYAALSDVKADQQIDVASLPLLSFEEAPSRARRLVRHGDVIVATVGAQNRGFATVPEALDGHVVSTGFAVLRARPEVAHPGFLWALVRSREFVQHLVDHTEGTLLAAVKPHDLAAFKVRVPPLADQQRIVDLVMAIDDVQSLAASAASRAEAARSGIERGLFEVSDAPVMRLGEVAVISQGSALPTSLQGTKSGTYPWFKIADMTTSGNSFGYRTAATMVDDKTLSRFGARLWPAGVVVFPRVGAAVLTEKKRRLEVAGACDENHLVVTPGEGLDSGYLLAVLEHIRLSSFVRLGAVPSLNQELVRNVTIPVPPLDSQRTVAALVDGLRSAEEAYRNLAICVAQLRSTVIGDLLFGTNHLPSAYDASSTARNV